MWTRILMRSTDLLGSGKQGGVATLKRMAANTKVKMMAKKEKLDPEVEALIKWCTEVEGHLVAGGATLAQAQDHIAEQIEWFTDLFYDGLSPEEAAKEALSD
jgi:hypothetical protein